MNVKRAKSGFLAGISMEPNAIEQLRKRREESGLPVCDLSCSNPTKHGHIFPAGILQEAAAAYLSSRIYAPDPKGALPAREALKEYYWQHRGYKISEDACVLTASTSESYRLLFSLLADPGDNFLVPEVSYPLFDLLAQAGGVALKPYRMTEGEKWEIDYEHLRWQVDAHTRAVLLISPHNPTGNVLEAGEAVLAGIGLPLICDEVFAHFVDHGAAAPAGSLYPELPVFHLNGISKMFALPDLKLGWIVMSEEALRQYGERLELLNDCFLSASSLVQSMLPSIFEHGMGFCHEMTASVRRAVLFAEQQLRGIPGIVLPKSKGGAFVFARVDTLLDEEDYVLSLLEEGVLMHPGYFYGSTEGIHIMLSCIPGIEELKKGIEIIARVHAKLGVSAA